MQTDSQPAFQMTRETRKEILDIIDERIEQAQVFRSDIVEMKTMIRELIGIQKHAEARMDRLSETMQSLTEAGQLTELRIKELTEAQNRTEARMEELAEAQKRTEARLDRLSETVQELGEAEKRTEARMEELAEAQKRTEVSLDRLSETVQELGEAEKRTEARMEELAEAQKHTEITVANLVKKVDNLGTELGGLSRSVGYAMENEAYRKLPALLKEKYGIEIRERIIRLELDGDEINFFAHAGKDGQDVLIVGEAELKFSSVGKMKKLVKHVSIVKKHYPQPVIPMVVTHFAMPHALEAARAKGIIVIQSFEW